jgi:hypothetical protein
MEFRWKVIAVLGTISLFIMGLGTIMLVVSTLAEIWGGK